MSSDTLIQQWQTDLPKNGMSEIKNIQLILWATGLCVAGFDSDHKFVFARAGFFKAKWSVSTIQELIENDPLLSGAEPISNIWLAEERNLMIPKKLFDQNEAEAWIKKLYFIDDAESITYNYISNPPAYLVYPVNNKLNSLFNDYFPDANIDTLSNALLGYHAKNANAELAILNDYALLSLYQSKELKHHVLFSFDAVEDIVHKIGSLALQYGLKQEEVILSVSGIGEKFLVQKEELNQYFKLNEIQRTYYDHLFNSIAS